MVSLKVSSLAAPSNIVSSVNASSATSTVAQNISPTGVAISSCGGSAVGATSSSPDDLVQRLCAKDVRGATKVFFELNDDERMEAYATSLLFGLEGFPNLGLMGGKCILVLDEALHAVFGDHEQGRVCEKDNDYVLADLTFICSEVEKSALSIALKIAGAHHLHREMVTGFRRCYPRLRAGPISLNASMALACFDVLYKELSAHPKLRVSVVERGNAPVLQILLR